MLIREKSLFPQRLKYTKNTTNKSNKNKRNINASNYKFFRNSSFESLRISNAASEDYHIKDRFG